jgi:hypothetical protein
MARPGFIPTSAINHEMKINKKDIHIMKIDDLAGVKSSPKMYVMVQVYHSQFTITDVCIM